MYLGIDTSAYTTSAAIVEASQCVWENRRLLEVPEGKRGLAQSQSFFRHTLHIPDVLEGVPPDCWPRIQGIGVSAVPRPVRGSYMPVFCVGVSLARGLACALRIPLVETSHQEGHIAAGLWSSGLRSPGRQLVPGLQGADDQQRFLSFHVSGGTTELLHVTVDETGGFGLEIVGWSEDLHAGQFIDRVGVSLGLPFPAGPHLAALSLSSCRAAERLLPSAVKKDVKGAEAHVGTLQGWDGGGQDQGGAASGLSGVKVSFSGVESAAQRLIQKGTPPQDVARAVEGCCLRSFAKMIEFAVEETGLNTVLMIGGVAANGFLRERLPGAVPRARFFWAEAAWSSDNAAGVALIAQGRLSSHGQ
ncbi:MAG: O-sialoglycoprotein endopeptidase [Peptococcaceae bacterium]|nr:O-sialoglycoprotein endopeptidase [Peptococcaceae bacterium]